MTTHHNEGVLKASDVEALINFSATLGKLSNEGKVELMDKIMMFIETGDKSLLPK